MDRHSPAKFSLSSSVDCCSVNNLVVIKRTSVLFSFSLSLFMVIQDLILLRHISTCSKGASDLISRGKYIYVSSAYKWKPKSNSLRISLSGEVYIVNNIGTPNLTG